MSLGKLLPNKVRAIYRKFYWLYNNHQLIHHFEDLKKANFNGQLNYHTEGLATSNNADFIREPGFAKAYKEAAATNPWEHFTAQWRVYIVCWFADHVKGLKGDFVECGVNTGAYARAVIEYLEFNDLNKTFYLFDTFDGYVAEQITENEQKAGIGKYIHAYKDVYEQVIATFQGFNVKIVKGMVPETLSACQSEEICFLSIDMNAVTPEIAAAEYFWPKIVKGGVIILDDYGFPGHIEQKKAFDQFALQKGLQILSLPTGQGILIK